MTLEELTDLAYTNDMEAVLYSAGCGWYYGYLTYGGEDAAEVGGVSLYTGGHKAFAEALYRMEELVVRAGLKEAR